MATKRPVIRDLKRSTTDVVLEVLALVGVLVLIALPAFYYSSLPDSIPRHFNLKGEADGFGDQSSLLSTPVVGAVLYVAVTVLSRFPHLFNYLWPITEANARQQYAISVQMMSALKLQMVAIFVYITWSTIGTALGSQNGLSPLFLAISTPALLVTIIFYLVKGQRAQ